MVPCSSAQTMVSLGATRTPRTEITGSKPDVGRRDNIGVYVSVRVSNNNKQNLLCEHLEFPLTQEKKKSELASG